MQEEVSPALRVFISYSRRDSAFVERLQAALASKSFDPIFDTSHRPSADPDTRLDAQGEWWAQLKTMIAASDVMVFVVTPHSASSDVCDDEIAYARDLGKRVVPILREGINFNSAPERLRALNVRLDFRDDSNEAFGKALEGLVSEIEHDADWNRRGSHFTRLAQRWDASGRPVGQLLRTGAIQEADEWAARRPGKAPAPGPLLLEFLEASRQKELSDRLDLEKRNEALQRTVDRLRGNERVFKQFERITTVLQRASPEKRAKHAVRFFDMLERSVQRARLESEARQSTAAPASATERDSAHPSRWPVTIFWALSAISIVAVGVLIAGLYLGESWLRNAIASLIS